MVNLLRTGLIAVGVVMFTAPGAYAATTIGLTAGAGTDPGEAISVTGDRRVNDITITLSRTTVKIVDRRARVRLAKVSARASCRLRGRHTAVCGPLESVYASLGAGNDRFTVKTTAAPAAPAGAPSAYLPVPASAPDGLSGLPSDEGEGGSFLGWKIDGGAGDDRIVGSPSFDHITGGPGSDVLYGRGGDDLFDEGGEPGEDTIFGGSGDNAFQWRASTPLHIDLGKGRFNGGSVQSIDKVRGGAGNDTLIGSDAAEMLQGADGADAIAGLGGPDLLIGDDMYSVFSPGADTIAGGAGDDLLELSNSGYEPYGPVVVHGRPGPPDSVSCGDGNDRIAATSAQLVPVDCEGARFQDAATTVPLRPAHTPDGGLAFDVPCPAQSYVRRPVGVCGGTLTLTRHSDGKLLGSSPFALKGGTHAPLIVKPASPIGATEAVSVQIKGSLDNARPDNTLDQFDFGWATTF